MGYRLAFNHGVGLFRSERHAIHALAAKVVVLVEEERPYTVKRHSYHTIGRLMDRYEELLLLAGNGQGDRSASVGIGQTLVLLAVLTIPLGGLNKSLAHLVTGNRLTVKVERITWILFLFLGESLDFHLWLLS